MSIDLWSVHFSSPSLIFGSGIVLMDGDSIMGGDGTFYYRGKCTKNGSAFFAMVDIIQHSPGMSIFGNLSDFTLALNGNIAASHVVFSGNILHQSQFKISGTMKKIAIKLNKNSNCQEQWRNPASLNFC
jgi:hypothetical protein